MPSHAVSLSCAIALWLSPLAGVCLGQPTTPASPLRRSAPVRIVDGPHRFVQDGWTTENGLPQNSVTSLVQTRDGYLWVGTSGGLARFDGVRFTIFNSLNTPELKSNRILCLIEDEGGALWIGTERGGLTRLKHGRFRNFGVAFGLPDDSVSKMSRGREGSLWLFSQRGSVRLRGDRIVERLDAGASIPVGEMRAIAEDPAGALWIAALRGVIRTARGPSLAYAARDGLPHDHVDEVTVDREGALWVASKGGLARIDGARIVTFAPPPGAPAEVRSPHLTARGDLWVPNGPAVLHVREGRAVRYALRDPAGGGARAVLVDREGTLWIGTDINGLLRWREPVVTSFGAADGLAGTSAMSVYEDRDGNTWIGNWCGGLSRFSGGRFEPGPVRSGCVSSILQARDGALWLGTSNGVRRLSEGVVTEYGPADGLPDHAINAVYEDRAGAIWVGTRSGLCRRDGDRFTVFRARDGLVHDDVRFLLEDRAGRMWIGTAGGLGRFEGGRFTRYTTADGLSHNFVRAIHEDADGTLWLGTYGGGLTRLKDGRFAAITSRQGLFDDVVSRILEGDRGDFWMSGNRGIFRASRAELNAVADRRAKAVTSVGYGVADGMTTSETNGGGQPAGWRTSDGRLWFPTIRGVAVIDPSRLNALVPPVVVEEALIDGTPADAGDEIEVPPGARSLEIRYTALSLAAGEKVRFRYRLHGYDEDWVEAGDRRAAYYTNLPPRRYRFQVIAANNDGVWNEAGAALAVAQRPRFHQTWGFLGLCAAALALAALGGHRLRVRALTRRTLELEARIAQRTAEVVRQKDQLAALNAELERGRDDLLATYDRLRVGVLLVNQAGMVSFVSRAARDLLGRAQAPVQGHWHDVLPLGGEDRRRLTAMVEAPRAQRAKLLVRLAADTGRQYWMEAEIEDDPRDADRRIIFLYDVSEVYDLRRLLDDKARFLGLLGQSAAMQLLFKQIRDLAAVDTTVLIEGETGTGKELVARAIHYASARKARPFVAINCAGLTESLLASQLFGHRRGAFTGAVADQVGHFEAAHGGTIFLDEIGEIPASAQTSLLRVLQEREIARLGESQPRKIDVRVIAASNRDLMRAVGEGRFRQDLLYRIRVARLEVPPLRQRRDDIPLLTAWFLSECRQASRRPVHDISAEAMEILLDHPWPGNVRELRAAVETAVIHAAGPAIQPGDLPRDLLTAGSELDGGDPAQLERDRLVHAFREAAGNRSEMARLLGISRATLYRRLASLNLELKDAP